MAEGLRRALLRTAGRPLPVGFLEPDMSMTIKLGY